MLKTRVLGLAAIERARRRQASRVLWIRAGDASTKFFHAKCNNRRRKNYIHTLRTAGGEVLSQHQEKAQEIFRHFSNQLGKRKNRPLTINWDQIQLPQVTGVGLDNPFSEGEVWAAVVSSPAEKAPGPDGFTGQFFCSCWSIIKDDIMAVFSKFYMAINTNFSDLNKAFITLIPKKEGAREVKKFRPISLMSSVAKLITKVISMRLAAVIPQIISQAH